MAQYQNTFNGGTSGATITEVNSGGASGTPWDLVEILAGATATYSSSTPAHGARCASVTGNGAHAFLHKDFTANTKLTARFYVRLPALPSASFQLYTPRHSTNYIGGVNVNTAGKLQVTTVSGASVFTTTAALSLNTWYRVEISHEVGTSTTGKINFKYFLGDSTTALDTFTSTTADLGTNPVVCYRIGKINNTGNTPVDLDSITVEPGSTAYLGPHTDNNVVPTAVATASKTVDVEPGEVVALTGSASNDPDGSIVSYSWTQTSGPTGTFSGAGANRTWTAPATLAGGVAGLRLTVTDNLGASTYAAVSVAVLPVTERAAIGSAWVPLRVRALSSTVVTSGGFGNQTFGTSPFGG